MDMMLDMIVISYNSVLYVILIYLMKLAIKLNESILFLYDIIKMSKKTTTKEKKAPTDLVSNVYYIFVFCIEDLYGRGLLKLIFLITD